MTFITIEGYFSEQYVKKLVQLLSGKTFYNFKLSYGYDGCNCNCVLTVGSDYGYDQGDPITEDELRASFMWYALCCLADSNIKK
jgi:hypothetical protein